MTADVRRKPRRFARLLSGGWSTGLFAIGTLFDIVCVMNVPGAATFTGGADAAARVTPQGTLLVLLVIACWATVFVRVRAPVAVVVAGGILLVVGVSYVLALVGAYCCLLRWPRKTALIAGLSIAAVLLYVVREVFTGWGHALAWLTGRDASGDASAWHIASAVIAVCSLALVGGLAAYQRARVEASVHRVEAEHQHERADALDEQLARQSERERIARDLHDGLGHRLSSMALAAGAFEAQAAVAPVDPALAQWAGLVRRQAHEALEDVRGVVGGLRAEVGDGPVAPHASVRRIGALLADLRASGHRIDAHVFVEGLERSNPERDAAAYRITQESLTNAIKHAPGAAISVWLDAAPDRGIRIRVTNPLADGPGPPPGGRQGIQGIRERAAAAGGTAWIGPHEGRFIVDVSLPWA